MMAVTLKLRGQPFAGSKLQYKRLTLEVRKTVNMYCRNKRFEKSSAIKRTLTKAAIALLETGKENIFSGTHIHKLKEDGNGMSFDANDPAAFDPLTGHFR